jgi:hypothetical protein
MTIQSKFKDYYDHIGLRYGQDPQIVYERKPLKDTGLFGTPLGDFFKQIPYVRQTRKTPDEFKQYTVQYLVAASRVIPFIVKEQFSWDDPANFASMAEYKRNYLDKIGEWGQRYCPQFDLPNCGVPDDVLRQVIKLVGAPVFLLFPCDVWQHGFKTWDRIPVLADWGVPSLVPPEQMWQAIYGVLQNVLRDNPDKNPPVLLTNDSRIQKAGFDLVTSFRGK